mmetsp:Transcript_12525/g.24976  ORF Transcript_12525/g.24976 Transcript_12525/m.24976 type:complete len:198 (+) Transcript_12525:144-737(+)|eukprot:CAMPEP_0194330954 /NCGR_PEP_ID=MMETSP0171-20130528/53853_1 /TAXON_ID=218684 /ORGANISM="Corethron pennatum, Strain L29A3" /LENGTH=197 /DNA_ID=CAMNT_0039092217 /DNA_START=113 /DNA_END=706 /DNA_ORIENTATION=-
MISKKLCAVSAALIASVNGFSQPRPYVATSQSVETSKTSVSTRAGFLQTAIVGASGIFGLSIPAYADAVKSPSGVLVEKLKIGDGPKPVIGELAAVRFRASVVETGNKLDDLFDNPEPYYTRVGSGGLLKGVEEFIPQMVIGDRWKLTIPGNLAFGKKGRPSSAGKPRIPADATIIFEIEMVGLPGREQELIDIIGD